MPTRLTQRPALRLGRARLAMAGALAVSALGVPTVVAVAPAQAATTCKAPKYPGQGYFTSLRVTGTSCATGSKVTLAHYKCRVKKGKAGKCTSVSGYRCTESRKSIPTEIDGRVTCKKGKVTVVYTYQQDL